MYIQGHSLVVSSFLRTPYTLILYACRSAKERLIGLELIHIYYGMELYLEEMKALKCKPLVQHNSATSTKYAL